MKTFALALLVAALAAGPALAQTEGAPAAPAASSRCGEMPAAPTVPDGATSNRRTMDAAREAYEAWAAQAQTVLSCRRAEVEELRARSDALIAEYNAAGAQARAAGEQMTAEAAEFNAR